MRVFHTFNEDSEYADYWAPGMLYCLQGFDANLHKFNAANVHAWAKNGLGDWKRFCTFMTCDDPAAFDKEFDGMLTRYAHRHYLASESLADQIADLMKLPNPQHAIANYVLLLGKRMYAKYLGEYTKENYPSE
jgi:hypothetical protein